jgi:hypothetical protein
VLVVARYEACMREILMNDRVALLAAAALLTSACGTDGPGSGGMTAGENDKIEEAAERLDARAPSPAQPMAAQLEAEVAERIESEQRTQNNTQ